MLSFLLLWAPVAAGQEGEEQVSWEEEEQAAIRGPRLQAAPVQEAPPGETSAAAPTGLPTPQLLPLPEIETSAWTLLFPGACLALVALNVGWRRKRRAPRTGRGGSDE